MVKPFFTAVVSLAFLWTINAGPLHAESALTAVRVVQVHDGDTVSLAMGGRVKRARLIGIDAPEMGQEPWGERAKARLERLIQDSGGKLFVETDVEERDKYGRILVYLWTDGRVMLNEKMLRDGYAVLFTIQPNSRHVGRFVKAQREARTNKRGIWGPDGLRERPLDYKKAHHPRNRTQ